MSEEMTCPSCDSPHVLYMDQRKVYLCQNCFHQFTVEQEFKSHRIFISYGHDEYAELAEQLKEDLIEMGHQVWFDLDRLKSGHDWETYIEEGINWTVQNPALGRMILLMTPHSVRRPNGYCLNEIAYAMTKRLPIVPVMVAWTEAPLSICRIQWLDMQDCFPINNNYEDKLEQLISTIQTNVIDFEGSQAKIIRCLEPLPFDAELMKNLNYFTGRQWILDKIESWLQSVDDSRVFWVTGAPGVGKTAIASWLCQNQAEVVAFHLCQYGNKQKNNPTRAIKSIAYQLGTQLPEYFSKLKMLDLDELVKESDAKTLFDLLLVQPLSTIAPPSTSVTILIDALDEATKDGKNDLASFLATEFYKTPDWLRLIITSRPDPEVTYPLQGLSPYFLDTNSTNNEVDMRQYINEKLLTYAVGVEVTPAMIDIILAKSEGVFLYLHWIRNELESGRLSFKNIENFPQGLGGVYAHYFERQFTDIEKYKKSIRPVFEVITAAEEPLSLEELIELFKWDEYEIKEIKYNLGSLFTMQNEEIRAFHSSILNWLTDIERSGRYFTSAKSGHELLAQRGWDQYKKGVSYLSEYMLEYLPYHLKKAGKKQKRDQLLIDLSYWDKKFQYGGIFGGYNFSLRPDGLKALQDYYDFSFGKVKTNETSGSHQVIINYDAIENGIMPVGMGFATDGRERSEDIITLIDDKQVFNKHHPAPVFRKELLDKYPEIAEWVDELPRLLTTEVIIHLNKLVEQDGIDPRQVAKQFLLEQGLIDDNPAPRTDRTVVVGSKLYTEQFLLSALTIELLEYHGYCIIDKRGVGNFEVTRQTIEKGEIDTYWDYVSTGYSIHLKQTDIQVSIENAYQFLKEEDLKNGLVWLSIAPYNNCFTFMMKKQVAEALNITSISDLSAKFKQAKRKNKKKEKKTANHQELART